MTENNIFNQLEELEDVTSVESETAQRTYVVWIHGYTEPNILEEIERVSGWSLISFYGAMGTDMGLLYADTREEDKEFDYDVSVTSFDAEKYKDHESTSDQQQ